MNRCSSLATWTVKVVSFGLCLEKAGLIEVNSTTDMVPYSHNFNEHIDKVSHCVCLVMLCNICRYWVLYICPVPYIISASPDTACWLVGDRWKIFVEWQVNIKTIVHTNLWCQERHVNKHETLVMMVTFSIFLNLWLSYVIISNTVYIVCLGIGVEGIHASQLFPTCRKRWRNGFQDVSGLPPTWKQNLLETGKEVPRALDTTHFCSGHRFWNLFI